MDEMKNLMDNKYNAFIMSPTKWISNVTAIGIVSKAGRYGGTYAHFGNEYDYV